MKQIKILSSSCKCGHKSAKQIAEMIKNMNADAEVSIVDDIMEVVKYGVMTTPAIVVDEKVVHIGSVPKEDELKNWL